MNRNGSEESVPSRQRGLLTGMVGHAVVEMVRYSWHPPERECQEFGTPPSLVFSLADGPLIMQLNDGLVIGFGANSEFFSVTVWLEKRLHDKSEPRNRFGLDPELNPIDARDPNYSDVAMRSIIGKRIRRVTILRRDPKNSLWITHPREVGIVIGFENIEYELVIGFGLYKDNDEMVVITRDQILPKIAPHLREPSLENRDKRDSI